MEALPGAFRSDQREYGAGEGEYQKPCVRHFPSDEDIQLYTALLRENLEAGEDCGEKQQNLRLLNEISAQAEKLDFLIRSLTKMSRLESNIVEVKPCRQKVAELLEAVIWDAEVKAEQKGMP